MILRDARNDEGRAKKGVLVVLLVALCCWPLLAKPSTDGTPNLGFVPGEVIVQSTPPRKGPLPPGTIDQARLTLLYCIDVTGDCVYRYPTECGAPEAVAARLSDDIFHCRAPPKPGGGVAPSPSPRPHVVPNAILKLELESTKVASAPMLAARDPDERLVRQTELLRMGAKNAWSAVSQKPEIITAVIDSGVQLDHPDLASQLVPGTTIPCTVQPCDGAAAGVPHGTTMAGTIAAERGTSGIVGTAWNSRIMPFNITNDLGYSNDGIASLAIQYALSHDARVLNLSFVSDKRTEEIDRVVNAATQNFLLVVSAGNIARDIDPSGRHSYPASLKNKRKILAVMSHDKMDRRECLSAWGKETIDIAAPGAVDSSIICMGAVCYGGSENSTSNATSYVSGAAALLWSVYPDWKAKDIRWRILENALLEPNLANYLYPPRRLHLERMMFPVRFNAASDLRQVHAATLRTIELEKKPLTKQLDISTTFPEGMCETVEIALLRANRSSQEFLAPKNVKQGDTVQFLATCHRARETYYTARSVAYEVIN